MLKCDQRKLKKIVKVLNNNVKGRLYVMRKGRGREGRGDDEFREE